MTMRWLFCEMLLSASEIKTKDRLKLRWSKDIIVFLEKVFGPLP